MIATRVEVWETLGSTAEPYERRPSVEGLIASYELRWQAGRPERGIFRSTERWGCVSYDTEKVVGEQVEPVLPLVRIDVYGEDTLLWRGWVVEERYTGDLWQYEVWGIEVLASLTTLWVEQWGVEGVDEVFLKAFDEILKQWDGGRTPYTLHANCPKRVSLSDYRAGISGSAFLENLQQRAPRHFILEGEWENGRWGVKFVEPNQMEIVPAIARIDEQVYRMHTVRNRVQVIGTSNFEAGRQQYLRNGDLTQRENVKSPRDLVDDPNGTDVGNTGYWQLAQNVVSDAELRGGYTGDTYARFTANSNCRLHSAIKSVVGYEGLSWRGTAAFRKGSVSGTAQVVMMIKARDPVANQTTTLWTGNLTLTDEYEWKRLESPPVSPRPGYTQMWIEIESAGGNCNGVRIDAIHLCTSGQRLREWQTLWREWTTNLPQQGYGYADAHANAGRYGLDGGAQVWLEPGWMFGQKVKRPDFVNPLSATVYLMLWYTRGSYNNQTIEPQVVLWQSGGVWQYGTVWHEGDFDGSGEVRWRLYRWQNITLPVQEFWVGLWSDTAYLWGVSVWGAWLGFEPIEDATGFLGSGNAGKYWADGYRTAYLPHTDLGSNSTDWMVRSANAWGTRYGRYNDNDMGSIFELGAPEAWRLRTQVAAEPYRQLRVSTLANRLELLQPHRYLWRIGVEDYFVGTLIYNSDGTIEASLHEPETDLIRALRSVL